MRLALSIALVCCAAFVTAAATAASAFAAAPIAPAALVPKPLEMPGFGFAHITLRAETSPTKFAKTILGDDPSEMRSEVPLLKRNGFREGVEEGLSVENAGAQILVVVLGSARGAKSELQRAVREAPDRHEPEETRFTNPAISGSQGLAGSGETVASATHPAEARRYADLLFAFGRCFFIVGDSIYGTSTREEALRAPLAGATALVQRVKAPCRA